MFFSEGARLLVAQDRPATLVQIANRSSRAAAPGMGAWAAGWHGVRALTLAAADELREHGIHVALVIVDGPIESPKTAHDDRGAGARTRSTTRPTSRPRSSASPARAGAVAPTS